MFSLSHYKDLFFNKYYPLTILNRQRARRKNHNDNFSIICATCIGGYIYHQLGKKFQSPTINLNMFNSHFYKFIMNIEHYLSLGFVPTIDKIYPKIPSGKLDDIVVHFTHYPSYEEGVYFWNKRKTRLDLDNLYIICSDVALNDEQIKNLGKIKCKKMVVFTSKEYPYPYCLHVKRFDGMPQVGDYMGKTIFGKWKFEEFFDYVTWLNSDDQVAQHFCLEK